MEIKEEHYCRKLLSINKQSSYRTSTSPGATSPRPPPHYNLILVKYNDHHQLMMIVIMQALQQEGRQRAKRWMAATGRGAAASNHRPRTTTPLQLRTISSSRLLGWLLCAISWAFSAVETTSAESALGLCGDGGVSWGGGEGGLWVAGLECRSAAAAVAAIIISTNLTRTTERRGKLFKAIISKQHITAHRLITKIHFIIIVRDLPLISYSL